MSRAPFIFDFVALFLVLALPALLWGISMARGSRNLRRHRTIQLALAGALLLVVGAFELSLNQTDWREATRLSPYAGDRLQETLRVHLVAAVTALALWVVVPISALIKFARPPRPGPHSQTHRILGGLTVVATVATAISGWIFYYRAFVAQ